VGTEYQVGDVLASKYRLEELLGSGGMGHVYRAVNQLVGRAVAIKLLRSEHASNAAVKERFLREARAANLVRHPHVVDVLDIGEDRGAPFIVQELLDGEDLAHYVARRGGKLSLEEVADLVGPVIEAVAEAHARGVVHRDIKPENVFLVKAKRGFLPKLLDFGISKVRAPDLRATEVGLMMGTPAYMAPEQIQGAREADPRSDVWALGVMLFELLAGRLPFDGIDAPALFVAIATKDAPTLIDVRAEVTPAVSQLVERCLRRRPDERYPSASELARDLRHVLEGTDLEATGTRSIPPEVAKLIPDLRLATPGLAAPVGGAAGSAGAEKRADAKSPGDGPAAPTAPGPAGVPDVPALDLPAARAPLARTIQHAGAPPAEPTRPGLPNAPSLSPPAPRASGGMLATPRDLGPLDDDDDPAAPSDLQVDAGPAPRSSRRLPAAPPSGSLPGVGLAPGAAPASSRRMPAANAGPASYASHGSYASQAGAPGGSAAERTQAGPVMIALAAVGLAVILPTGLLMQLAHRPDGWPLAKFFAAPAPLDTVLHGGLGLVCCAIGATYSRRALRTWRGDLGGGASGAIVSALIASATFFCAIELVSALS